MKLMTKAIEKRFAQLGRQDHPKAIIVAKFFNPVGAWTWYATEYSPVDRIFFGMVHGHEKELGSFSLDELESIKGPLGLGIERDLHWTEKTLEELEASHA